MQKLLANLHSWVLARFLILLGVVTLVLLTSLLTLPRVGHATFPGANGKIAFSSNRGGGFEIYVMNADGSNPTSLTNNPAQAAGHTIPAWSPDGSKIAFGSDRDGNFEIYAMNADGSNPTRLTNNPEHDDKPVWSPDGSRIAFRSRRDGVDDVYAMNADGSNVTNLTNRPTTRDLWPAWSPDGSKIAFESERDGNFEIYAMNADGSNPTRLTNNSAHDRAPDWSPDGSKIAFHSDRDGNFEIYAMNADGSNPTRLTNNSAGDFVSAWSPDGSKIAFESERDGNFEIYVMNVDGSGQTRLTNNTATDENPAWGPLVIHVSIDIKPSSDPNCFNNNDKGVIPVAILGSVNFDATRVDDSTVKLEGLAVKAVGKKGNLLSHIEDVNADGFSDLVVQIQDQDSVFQQGTSTATLTGNLKAEFGGTPIEGTDSICITP